MQMIDGSGRGFRAKVNKYNQQEVLSYAHGGTVDLNARGRTFVIYDTKTPAGANNVFLYLGNDGTEDIHVEEVTAATASAETVDVYLGATSNVASGTAYTPRPLNQGVSAAFEVDAQTGTNITSTDSAKVQVGWIACTTANKQESFKPESRVILKPGKALILTGLAGSIAVKVGVRFSVWPNEM